MPIEQRRRCLPKQKIGFSLPFLLLLILVNSGISIPLTDHVPASVVFFPRSPSVVSSSSFELNDQNILLFEDLFRTYPYGYDQRIWERMKNSSETLWQHEEQLVFESIPNSFSAIRSTLDLNPDLYVIGPDSPVVQCANGLIVDFEFTFTSGDTYFAIGWIDTNILGFNNWTGNFREAENGVYLDYWDGRVHLVVCNQGERKVMAIPDISLYETQRFRLIWRESIALLLVDGEVRCCIYENIPMQCMPLVIAAAGFDQRAGIDKLTMEQISLYTFGTLEYPELALPILLWPQNGSHILSTNEIYFDIYGGTHELSYSWDFGGWYMIPEPWTISVPSDGGWHTLQIEAENYFGQITSQEYRFYVEHQLTSFSAYEMSITPEIDGIRQSWEKDDASEFELIFLSEDGTTSHSKMSVGFLNDSLYLGVETSIPDGLYTSIMIYIDADGSHRWGDSSPGVVMDYLVSVNAPSSLIEENIVMFCDGSSITLQDSAIEFAVATQNDLISFEGIFNSETLNPDMSQVQFSVRIQQGGVSDYFPLPYYSLESFQLATIEYLGPKPTHTFLFVGIVVGLGVLMIGVLSLTYRKSKLVSSPFLKPLPEEELERVRTLVISYPRVRLEKLQSMSGLSDVEFESALSRLIQNQIVDVDITPTGEVVRNRDSQRAQISGPKTGK